MIMSPTEDIIVSSLGWTDGGSLWILDTKSDSASLVPLSDAKYLSLHNGQNGYFSVLHHYDGDRIEITAHSMTEPGQIQARILVSPEGKRIEGETTIWKHLPNAYVAFFKGLTEANFCLFLVEPNRPAIEINALDWYDDSYDKLYQSVVGVVEVPNQDVLIVSVQRDSHPVLINREFRNVIGKLSLADRCGNPTLRFRKYANELWAADYDTLLRLDPSDWTVKNSLLLQGASAGCQQFIGSFNFNAQEGLCAVARPFSGDVIALDTTKFKVTHLTRKMGGQPLKVALLANGTVYARDWKTGELLVGTLRKQWFTWPVH